MDLYVHFLIWALSHTVEVGPVSTYRPGDGYNAGTLACGGQFTKRQVHIAHRRWRRFGCGSAVGVYSKETGRFVLTTIQDAGPYGIIDRDKNWKVWTKSFRPPKGWRFRGLVDLSWALWKKLGKPKFLSKVVLYHLNRDAVRLIKRQRRNAVSQSVRHLPQYAEVREIAE